VLSTPRHNALPSHERRLVDGAVLNISYECAEQRQRLAADYVHHRIIIHGLAGHCDAKFATMDGGSYASIVYLVAVVRARSFDFAHC
jgi:hypothetical protein